MLCNELVARAYAAAGFSDYPVQNFKQIQWFEGHSWFTTNPDAGQRGDVIYFQKSGDKAKQNDTHAVMITGVTVEDGVVKYTILQSGLSGSKEYNTRFYTIDEISIKFSGKKKFVGIGSVPRGEAPMTIIVPPAATPLPADFKVWANASHTVYRTTSGEYKLFNN